MSKEKFRCDQSGCNQSFSRPWNLHRHKQRKHLNSSFSENCLLCGKTFAESDKLQKHLIIDHGPSDKFYEKESAFHRAVLKYRFTFDENQANFNAGQMLVLEDIKRTIRYEAAKKRLVKVSLVYICQMSMLDHIGEKIQTTLIPFRGTAFISNALKGSGLSSKIKKSFREQENVFEEFCESGSSWTFDRAVAFDIEISGVKPLVIGSTSDDETDLDNQSYHSHRVNITNLKNKRFLFNPKNSDQKCFLRCVFFLLKLGSVKNFQSWEKSLNLKGIKFPITINLIKKFVKQNTHLDIKINILFRALTGEIFPFECGIGNGGIMINLLMLDKSMKIGKKLTSEKHFLAIKNVNRYLSSQYQNNENKIRYENAFFCLNCFNKFSLQSALTNHEKSCSLNKPIKEVVQEGKIMFKNHHLQHVQDYLGFLDFECILEPGSKLCSECRSLRCKCDKSFSEIVTHQEPIAFSFVILGRDNKIIHEHTFAGENAVEVFIDHLLECYDKWVKSLLETILPLKMTFEDERTFNNSTSCYLCHVSFEHEEVVKCRDHNHFTGKFIGAACQQCNLKRQRPRELPIFLHNGSKYDFHFIIKALNRKKVKNIRVLPYNGEHFRTISFNGFKFLDSLAFLQASLAQLSSDLSKTSHDYQILKQTYLVKTSGKFDKNKLNAVLQKSFFPYEFCSSLDLMKKTTKIPSRKHFYSQLSEKSITREDHEFAKNVWEMFDCKNLLDYTKIYCKIDTILLAEIFQKFRSDMLGFSGLDPSHYISLPAYAFDSMMKLTNCELDKLDDINMVHFIESSIRGGVSFINTRYLQADEDGPEEIVYIDANNLYGHAQMSKLPYNDFIWMEKDEYRRINWKEIDTENNYGYFLEVDLDYPKELHQSHSNFPLAPENVEVSFDNLSDFSKSVFTTLENKERYSDVKLVSTLHNRENYVLHFKNLKLYLELGMKLKKIHKVLRFRQKQFIAPFIMKCTLARQKSKTKFEQDQFKKVANCVYGKTIQNTRNYMQVKLHTKVSSLKQAISNPTFKNFTIIGNNLVQTNHSLSQIVHDKPIYAGFAILELSKHFMFDFYYNTLVKDLKCELDLGMSDTDSLLFKVSDSKIFRAHIRKHMDYSNYPTENPLYTTKNKAKLGYFKDELAGKQICTEFFGLKSKCYAMKLKDSTSNNYSDKKVCKGLGRVAITNRLKFKHYKNCLFKGIPQRFDFHSIVSKQHNVSTMRLNKRAISHFDAKRWIHHCGIHSDPYGSIMINRGNILLCQKCHGTN